MALQADCPNWTTLLECLRLKGQSPGLGVSAKDRGVEVSGFMGEGLVLLCRVEGLGFEFMFLSVGSRVRSFSF